MFKIFIQITLLFIVFFLPIESKALTISPATLEVVSLNNEVQTFPIRVFNDGLKSYKIICYTSDVTFDEKGRKNFIPSGTSKNSITKYIKLSESSFILNGRESREVYVNINVPSLVKGGNNAMVFFQSFPNSDDNKGNNKRIVTSVRIGTTILQENPESIYIKSKIEKVNLKREKNSNILIDLDIINDSNTHLFASGYVAILNEKQNLLGSVKLPKTLITSNNKGKLKGEFKGNITQGNYQALITYSYRSKNFSIIKPFEINSNGELVFN